MTARRLSDAEFTLRIAWSESLGIELGPERLSGVEFTLQTACLLPCVNCPQVVRRLVAGMFEREI